MLNYINVKNITPHPDNPRRELGDLSELTESIRINGIFQNLTVVPWVSKFTGQPGDNGSTKDDYTVVIGHRRLAAAKAAGLTEVPCVIANMTEKEQISTMLLENMQRSDLTVYEQACGFQMMLDMGDTAKDISDKTGFSESTVRHRIKLAELDQDTFKKSAARNVTIKDYIELEKIESIELKNKVLAEIGTNNFNYKLQFALDTERQEKARKKIIEKLETFATRFDGDIYHAGYQYVRGCYDDAFDIPDDAEETEYVFTDRYNVALYKKMETEAQEVDDINTEKENQRRETMDQLLKIAERTYNLRCDFVKSLSNATAKKHLVKIIEQNVQTIIEDANSYGQFRYIFELMEIKEAEYDNDKEIEDAETFRVRNQVAEYTAKQPEYTLLLSVYASMYDATCERYSDNYYGKHRQNESLDDIYKFLIDLGYEMSDEEKQMQDGTHALFNEEETT